MNPISRLHSNPRLSRVVTHNGVAYLAGIVAPDCSQDAAGQTRQILARIDALLGEVGSSKERLLSVQIWMGNMKRDVDAMNTVWCEWVDPVQSPARATCQVTFDDPEILVEVIVTAAL
ncbi:RidA family protein (plasmid) [Pseudomonas luteola]|uniref:RidA family protein n=1 Tax=Pseudomonas TaxID=286 RepID=UPI000EFACFF8|nr:RidA family protein [Pseudomonas sp. LTJR-52]AYN96663.1 RidA family protein [Pseudomonas sp. LTJR-52]